MQANEIWKAHRPVKGQPIHRDGKLVGTVSSVEGNLCFVSQVEGEYGYDGGAPFIWCFVEGLNTKHDWPTKSRALAA